MTKNKIVDLNEYRTQKVLDKQIEELDRMGVEQYDLMSPSEQKGYQNFKRLLKALDKKHREKTKK